MSSPEPLQPGQYYHIYNRGINGEPIVREERNYLYFLKLYAKYIAPIAETYAYCLLSNHFHFLLRVHETGPVSADRRSGTGPVLNVSRQFNNFFIAYAKAFNKAFQRTGGLFESPFKRRLVNKDRYFTYLVAYIHRNPQRHGFVDNFRHWPYSSYRAILSTKRTRIQRAAVLEWFDGRTGFEQAHAAQIDEAVIEPLIADDWM
jgi:putative transposase